MTASLNQETVAAMADLAGYLTTDEDAARIARAIGPALAGFSAVEGTLPFEAEPSGFVAAQTRDIS